jgi:hypothetical protein
MFVVWAYDKIARLINGGLTGMGLRHNEIEK